MADKYTVEEIASIIGVESGVVIHYVKKQWLIPAASDDRDFDEEDLGRAQLICDLIRDMGVNDEAVPIILHLIDQIHFLRLKARHRTEPRS